MIICRKGAKAQRKTLAIDPARLFLNEGERDRRFMGSVTVRACRVNSENHYDVPIIAAA